MVRKLGRYTETMATSDKTIKLKKFFQFVNIFYLSIGMVAYDTEEWNNRHTPEVRKWTSRLLSWIFICQVLNLNLVLISELIYVGLAFASANNFLEATMNLCFIGYVVIGVIKIRDIWSQRSQLTRVVAQLQRLHPTKVGEQGEYLMDKYLRDYRKVSIFYFSMYLVLIWIYNLYWVFYYLVYDFWLGIRTFNRMLPYYCWTPWDWSTNWSYYVMYFSQNLAGQTCVSGQLAADMFMCALVTLLVMHFKRLATQIEQHVAGQQSPEKDLTFLQKNIVYHQRLLILCEDVNQIFGISLFCNFASSSFIICFMIFQITIGGNIDTLVMLAFFLFCAMVQVFMIGSYAQRLINASQQIGQAVYNHDWFDGELRYRQMLILIIKRAQRPSYLKASIFLNVSLITVTDLLQLSYKFFALLRTMYAK
ncbi:putative odorant receptor 85d [Drosophila sulfurigaster albostrigata]|uniref:putative odorant receptor 85d n=1 Tax=Drosophila sulfurigaster albostrigata TaxID=89887 RepID=UPI002D21CF7E|nr:putative odorant receptor 85d [Drosophila sulfurigaster albostrigata]